MQNKKMRALIIASGFIICNSAMAQEEISQPDLSQEVVVPSHQEATGEPVQDSGALVPVEPIMPVEPQAVEPTQEPAVESAPVANPEQEEIEIKGIDTVDIAQPKGNWLYKRIWWEKAERLYEKIKQLANEIAETRIVFFLKRHELDRTVIDPFYISMGIEQGGLEEITSYLTAQLEQDRTSGELDQQEQKLLDTISQEKKTLEQLGQGSQRITKLVSALEDALIKLLEQVNQARNYEQLSWEAFKAINRELSDKRARELYYNMDTYWKNLNNINTYLADSYTQYFDQLTSKIKEEVASMQGTVQGLKEKGVDIKLQAQKLRTGCKLPAAEQQLAAEESTGLLAKLWGWIKAPFVFVADTFGGLFGGGAEEVTLLRPVKGTQAQIDVDTEVQEDQQ